MSYCPKDVEMIIRPHNRKIIGKGEVGYIFPKISLTLLRWLSYRFLSRYRPYSKPLIFKTSLLTLIHLSAIWSFIKSHFHICLYTNTHIIYKCMHVFIRIYYNNVRVYANARIVVTGVNLIWWIQIFCFIKSNNNIVKQRIENQFKINLKQKIITTSRHQQHQQHQRERIKGWDEVALKATAIFSQIASSKWGKSQ